MPAPDHRRLVRAPGVSLVAPPDDGDGPRWVQIAREGAWEGHPSGSFVFDEAVFDQIIANFRSNPSYQAGPDGVGCCDVIAFDFHHASEAPATAVAVQGSPAQAWAQELEKRTGADGKLELWALTRYLEPMRTYVREGRYKWTSVAVYLDAVDPVSGAPCGAYLSSIAFTNDPFIQGMEPLAAARGFAAARPEPIGVQAMDEKFVTLLAGRFGIPTNPEAAQKRILAELDGAAQATALLGAICKALGIEDAAGATAKIASMMQQSAELEALMPQLAALKETQAKSEDAAAETDVEDVMASRKLPAEMRASLLFTRKGGVALDVKSKGFEADLRRRLEARDDFHKLYPMPGRGKEHLLSALATQSPVTQSSVLRSISLDASGRAVVVSPDAAPGQGRGSAVAAQAIRACAGRNGIEKAMAYLRAQPGGASLTFDQCHEQACLLVRSLGGERAIAAA